MTTTTAAASPFRQAAERAAELSEIHNAVCRDRRQGLVCATCHELAERAERAIRAAEVVREPGDELIVRDGVVTWTRFAA